MGEQEIAGGLGDGGREQMKKWMQRWLKILRGMIKRFWERVNEVRGRGEG